MSKIDLRDGSWESTSLTQKPAEPRPPTTPEGAEDWQLVGETAVPDPRTGYASALGQNPDRVAEVEKLSSMTGIDQSILEKNIDKGRDAANKPDFDKMVVDYPALARSMSDDRFAAVAKDDIDALMVMDDVYRKGAMTTSGRAYSPIVANQQVQQFKKDTEQTKRLVKLGHAGAATISRGQLGMEIMRRAANGEDVTDLKAKVSEIPLAGETEGFIEPAAVYAGQFYGLFKQALPKGGAMALTAATAAGGTAALLGQMGPQVLVPEELVTVPGAAFAAGSAALTTEFTKAAYEMEAGNAYIDMVEFIDKETGGRIDPQAAAIMAQTYGGIAALLETTGVGILAAPFKAAIKKQLKKRSLELLKTPTVTDVLLSTAKTHAKTVLGETAVELSQETSNMMAEELAKTMSDDEFAALSPEEAAERLLQVASETMRGMALFALPGTSTHFASEMQDVITAENNADLYKALASGPGNSKLAERLPERMKEFVTQIQADGGVENIYIDGEAFSGYFQSLAPDALDQLEQVIPGITKKVNEAVTLGKNVEIDAADFAAFIAPNHGDLLWQDIKLEDGAMSINESKAWRDRQDEEYQAALDREQLNEDQINAIETSADLVFDDQIAQLTASGRYTEPQARAQATAVKLFFRTMAAREGLDPKELYDSYGLAVKTELPAGAQAMVDQAVLEDEDIVQLTEIFDATGEVTVKDFVYKRETVDGVEVVNAYQVSAVDQAPVQVDNIESHIRSNDLDVLSQTGLTSGISAGNIESTLEKMERGQYVPDIPPQESRESAAPDLQAATDVARGVHETRTDSENESELSNSVSAEEQQQRLELKTQEAEALLPWAEENNLLRDSTAFISVWEKSGKKGGTEHMTAISPGGKTVRKLASAGMNSSWLQYLQRLQIHNSMFPDTAYTFLGFTEYNGGFYAMVEQPSINLENKVEGKSESQLRDDAHKYLEDHGFERRVFSNERGKATELLTSSEYLVDPETGVVIYDLHSDNVIQTPESDFIFIDPLIELDRSTKIDRVKAETGRAGTVLEQAGIKSFDPSLVQEIMSDIRIKRDVKIGAKTKVWRGVGPRSGEGFATYGLGLYTTTDKKVAKEFAADGGEVLEMSRTDLPDHPLRFDTVNDFQIWRGQALKKLGIGGQRGMGEEFGDLSNFIRSLDPEIDGVQIGTGKDAIFVQYPIIEDAVISLQAKAGGARGAISLTDGTTDLFLLENADLSTYLHEVGHLFNQVMGDLATRDGASQQLQDDWAGLQKWLSVLDDDKNLIPQYNKYLRDTAVFGKRDFNALSDVEKESARGKAKLEYFARGFEAYLIDGKAPSSEMRSIFVQFKAWMKAIYASVKSLNIKLSPQVQEIYDRLFATDDEIAAAEYEMAYASLFTDATAAGMTEEEFAAYQGAVIKAREQAEEELMAESMKQIAREKTEAFRARKKEIREEVTDEVNQRQVHIARSILRHGVFPDGTELEDDAKIKLSSPDLKERGYTGKDLKPLAFMHVKEGGADIDTAAELLGYGSGEEMVSAFKESPSRAEAIKAGTDVIVQAEFGDVMGDPDAMHNEAIEAVHGTKRGSLLMTELKRLGKLSGDLEVAPEKIIKLAAERIVNEKLVRDLRPDQYQRAEAKAGRDVLKLVAKGEFEEAFQVQQRRVLNHHLYRASRDAKAKVDKQVRAMKRLAKPAAQKRIAKAKGQYLDQINALLDRFDFANVSLVKLDKRKSFLEFVNQLEADGVDVAVDPALFNEAMRINYKDLEVQDVNSVVETIKHLEHLATTKNKLLDLKEEKLLGEAVDELVMSAREHGKQQKKKPLDPRTVSRWGKLSNNLKDFDASLLKAEQVFDWLDGGDVDGPWSSYIWDAFAKAQDDESILLESYLDPLAKMILELTRERGAKMLDRVDIPEINETITRSGLLSIALNLGNDSNANKLINGYGWTDEQVGAIIDRLTEDDWKFVQGVWDLIDGLWPEIVALEQKVRGLKPEKVEPRPIPTKYGTFRGGYFPIVYDHASIAGSKQLSSEQKALFEETTTRATTPKGHTKARIDTYAAPILLDLGIIPQHLGKVIHDLTHRTAVMNANKLMGQKEVREAIQQNLGEPYVGMIDRWVKGVANDRAFFPEDGLGVWMKFLRRFRLNTSVVAMGFKATTLFSQFAGLTQSLDMIEKKYLVNGVQKMTKSPRKTTEWIFSLSREMHDRIYQRDRDIRDGLRDLVGKTDLTSKIKEVAFVGIGYADLYVAGATWVGAYEQKIDAGDSIDSAVKFANRVVRLTQGSGAAKDLAQVQREGNEVMKMLTMFYSYFSALYNRQRDLGRKFGSEDSYRRSLERALFLIVIPAIMGEVLAGRGPKEEDDEGFLEWAAKTVLIYPFMTVPLVRDVVSSVESGYDYRFSPMVSAGEKMVRVATRTGDAIAGEQEWNRVAKPAFEASGYLLGLPTGQAAITGGYIYDILTGEDDVDNPGDMMGFLFRREND